MEYIKKLRKFIGHDPILMCACGCLIFNEKGQVLLQKRSDDNLWGNPGGSMDIGETIYDTIIREIKEETNLDIKVDSYVSTIESMFEKDGIKFHEIYFIYTGSVIGDIDTNKVIENMEGKPIKYSFVDLDDIDDYYILPVVTTDIIKNKTSHIINREIK